MDTQIYMGLNSKMICAVRNYLSCLGNTSPVWTALKQVKELDFDFCEILNLNMKL